MKAGKLMDGISAADAGASTSPRSGLTRAEAVEWCVALRAGGMTTREIAAELCISRTYVRDLFWDPTGEKARARKRRCLMRPCERCDAPTWGRLCTSCERARQDEERVWTREAIVEAFQRFAAVAGRAAGVTDVPSHGLSPSMSAKLSPQRLDEVERFAELVTLPVPNTVRRVFGSWAAACEAAGLKPLGPGGRPAWRGRRLP